MMSKKKEKLRSLALITGALLVIGFVLQQRGILPLVGYEAVIVVCFPIFVICVFLWWMAREHGEDIPFIGY
jgi:hypothetical protein